VQDKFVQAIRYKLQKRVRRLNSTDPDHFVFALRLFFRFLDGSPMLAGIRDDLLARYKDPWLQQAWGRITKGEALFSDTEGETAALGYIILKRWADSEPEPNTALALGRAYAEEANTPEQYLDAVRAVFLEPLYEYLDEHIDDQQAILYFLRRYKHRCEWFQADRLRKLLEDDTQRGEKRLASDLYEYLHEEGIDFHIEPQSASGIADLVAEQVGDERVVADAKVYWPEKGKGKSYILSGFHQAYTYARDYNEPCAYLVIYKMSKDDINFLVPPNAAMFPSLSLNNKTVFFVVVDIVDHGASASKRGALKSVNISAEELVQSVQETAPPTATT
jgi:hypothetical protein